MNLILQQLRRHKTADHTATMNLMDHIEAFRWHLVRSLLAIVACSVLAFLNIEWIFTHVILAPAHPDFVSYHWFDRLGKWMHTDALSMGDFSLNFQNTELAGQFMMSFTVSFVIGLILAFPYVVWEFWKFIRPALHPHEIKRSKGIVFWLSFLFIVGVCFAYYIVAPFTISFFAGYEISPDFKNNIMISNYYDMMSDLMIGMGIVFELPVLVYFLSRVGILTPDLMKRYNKFAIIIILILASVITPPDWLSIWIVAIPLLLLYQLSIFISFRVLAVKK
ncbi:MAG: twin-arginine translocase subunit TatC [Taibaiella sp.]|nr:twin-arginine translocase subunit TatC [Taibaiella sp.]